MRNETEKGRLKRQRWELLAVHAVILAVLTALTWMVLHKAYTPVTADNTTQQLVAFDRYEREPGGQTSLYAGEVCYRVSFDAPGLSDVLAACGTGRPMRCTPAMSMLRMARITSVSSP